MKEAVLGETWKVKCEHCQGTGMCQQAAWLDETETKDGNTWKRWWECAECGQGLIGDNIFNREQRPLCQHCEGIGFRESQEPITCPHCRGSKFCQQCVGRSRPTRAFLYLWWECALCGRGEETEETEVTGGSFKRGRKPPCQICGGLGTVNVGWSSPVELARTAEGKPVIRCSHCECTGMCEQYEQKFDPQKPEIWWECSTCGEGLRESEYDDELQKPICKVCGGRGFLVR